MPDSFQMGAYLKHLRRRWPFIAILTVLALLSSIALTLLQTKRYTARVSLIIELPASGDLRATAAISPIYLESLKSYEHFALSDHLFAEAANRFGLRDERRVSPVIEALKRKILRVVIPRNTRILRIEVTLPDPKKAHEVATYLAERTIELNRSAALATDRELADRAKASADRAQERLKAEEAGLAAATMRPPTLEALRADLHRLVEHRTEVERLALSASLGAADVENRLNSEEDGSETASPPLLKARLKSIRTRAEALRQEAAAISSAIFEKEKQWAEREATLNLIQSRVREAQEELAEASKRAREISVISGYRNERINLLDPGFVPERPSSPLFWLQLAIALSLALMFSLLYTTIEYSLREQPSETARQLPRLVGKA